MSADDKLLQMAKYELAASTTLHGFLSSHVKPLIAGLIIAILLFASGYFLAKQHYQPHAILYIQDQITP